jgi:hypothetical protein
MIPLPKPKAIRVRPMTGTPAELTEQMGAQRRTVDFDTFDIQLQQILTMLEQEQISIAPAYQRQFRWDAARCSQLIESLILGIPIPNLFMATNNDNTWEVVDGLQRLCAIVKFAGSPKLRAKLNLNGELKFGRVTEDRQVQRPNLQCSSATYSAAHKDSTAQGRHVERQK